MTRAEFYSKYGDVIVTFSYYYKYVFHYCGELPNGKVLTCSCGGNASDIYRHEVSRDSRETVNSLQPDAGSIKDYLGITVDAFDDY